MCCGLSTRANYADSFGYQWQQFARTQLRPEFSERHFRRKTGLREEDLRGKLVLDVGCGMGRFADVATRWGARVVGIDLSAAAEVAATNLADRDFVAFQADVFALPFAPGIFDCIYSVGVLHHTPDCEKAFKNLPKYLKPGGNIAVWLYSGYNNWYRFSDHYRKITHRMSFRVALLFGVAVPCFYWLDRGLRAVPLAGPPLAGLVHHIFPVNSNRNPEIRMLDTLDWYSPKYQSKHTYEQVFRWFEGCGLENMTVADVSDGSEGPKALSLANGQIDEGSSESRHEGNKCEPAADRSTLPQPAAREGLLGGQESARSRALVSFVLLAEIDATRQRAAFICSSPWRITSSPPLCRTTARLARLTMSRSSVWSVGAASILWLLTPGGTTMVALSFTLISIPPSNTTRVCSVAWPTIAKRMGRG